MSKLETLCNRKRGGIRAEVTMTDDAKPEGFDAHGYSWRVTLFHRGRRLTVPFFTGSLAGEPDAAGVISCLLSDANTGDLSFHDFCSEFGYDEGSRRAEKTWRQCQDLAPKVRCLLGEDFEEFEKAASYY